MKKNLFILFVAAVPLLLQAQLANPGFEDWQNSSTGTERIHPAGWPLLDDLYLFREDDAYEGDYALTVSAWYSYLKTVAIQENAINERPVFFNGYYKYTHNQVRFYEDNVQMFEPDTAVVSVYITKWNEAAMQRDTIGSGSVKLGGSQDYTQFTCPITYSSEMVPDSVTVVFDPSKVRRFSPDIYRAYNDDQCSFFTVDALFFSNEALGITENSLQDAVLYPNPATDNVRIRSAKEISHSCIYDSTGKRIAEAKGDDISVTMLAPGLYTLLIYDSGGAATAKKFIKQ